MTQSFPPETRSKSHPCMASLVGMWSQHDQSVSASLAGNAVGNAAPKAAEYVPKARLCTCSSILSLHPNAP